MYPRSSAAADRGAQPLRGRHRGRAHDDDGLLGPHRPRGDGDPLDDRVRVALHERAVDLGAGVRLEAVGHDDAPALGRASRSRATCARRDTRRRQRPRSPDSLTMRMTASGERSETASR